MTGVLGQKRSQPPNQNISHVQITHPELNWCGFKKTDNWCPFKSEKVIFPGSWISPRDQHWGPSVSICAAKKLVLGKGAWEQKAAIGWLDSYKTAPLPSYCDVAKSFRLRNLTACACDSIADSVLCVIQIVRAIQVFKCQRAQGLKRNKHFWGDTRDDTASGNCPHTKCYFVYFWQRPSKTIQTLLTQEMTLYTSSAADAWEEVLESLEEWLKCQEADSYLVLSVSNKVLNSLALLLVCQLL